jgi:hypothetical protein
MATDWQKIKQDLSVTYGGVYLRCDSYLVYAHMTRHKMKLIIEVYVNGFIKGGWIYVGRESQKDRMGDIARKFYCLTVIRKTKRDREFLKTMEKLQGKRKCREEGYYDRLVQALPFFSTPGAFVSHLKKHNKSVEIIDRETHDREVEAKARRALDAEPA